MALPTAPLGTVAIVEEGPASPSAVSWAAVIGGALTAVASVLIRSGDSQLSGTVQFCRHGTDGMRDPEFVG